MPHPRPWPAQSQVPCSVRMRRANIPQWLSEILSLKPHDKVNTHQTKLSSILSSPASFFIITPAIPLPPSTHGDGAALVSIKCRVTHANLITDEVKLVLHNTTKSNLLDAYDHFLRTFPMRKVGLAMKEMLRRSFMAAVDAVIWKVGTGVLQASDSGGCGDLREFYLGLQFPRNPRRGPGRPPKASTKAPTMVPEVPNGLAELMEDAIEQVKFLFMPALPSDVLVSIWGIHWLIPEDSCVGFVQSVDSDYPNQEEEVLEIGGQTGKSKEIGREPGSVDVFYFKHPAEQGTFFSPAIFKDPGSGQPVLEPPKRGHGSCEGVDVDPLIIKKHKVFRPANIFENKAGAKVRYAPGFVPPGHEVDHIIEEPTGPVVIIEPDLGNITTEHDPFARPGRRWLGKMFA